MLLGGAVAVFLHTVSPCDTVAVVLTQHIPSVLHRPSDSIHQRMAPATSKLRSKMLFSYEWQSFYCTCQIFCCHRNLMA